MGEILLAAQMSDLIDPAFIKKFVAVKDHLEVVALTIREYKHNNKEQGTPLQVSEARKWLLLWIRFLLWSVLNYD